QWKLFCKIGRKDWLLCAYPPFAMLPKGARCPGAELVLLTPFGGTHGSLNYWRWRWMFPGGPSRSASITVRTLLSSPPGRFSASDGLADFGGPWQVLGVLNAARHLLSVGWAPRNQRLYWSAWRAWAGWCLARDVDLDSAPVMAIL
ncbi:Hypothetical predicted protein, partial [Pelobates cultripes]